MSDPLSVAASIAGLIALAGELYISLDEFISNVRDAPSLAQTIQSEIKSFRNSLNALHRVLQDPAFGRSKRAALISADYVVVSFTDAVLVFSQLETNVLPLTKFTDYGVVARTQWTRKKVKLNELVGRLQWQKHTLVLQLNILRCASDIEAERNRQVLDTLICERLGKDRDMERRLELVEQQLQLQSNASLCDRSSIISSRTTDSDNLTIRAGNSSASNGSSAPTGSYQHAFEELLNNSWVYRRNQNREEDMSMRSSVLRLSAWSVLSDMSLANISIIAVMSLPVQLQELSNGGWYSSRPDAVYGGVEDRTEVPSSPNSRNVAVDDEEYDTDEDFKTTWASNRNATTTGDHDTGKEQIVAQIDDERQQDVTTSIESIHEQLAPGAVAEAQLDDGHVLDNQHVGSSKSKTRSKEPSEEERRLRQQLGFPVEKEWRRMSDAIDEFEGLALESDSDDKIYHCKKCGEVMEEGKAFELGGNRWHIDCFRCYTCDVLLDSDTNLLLLGDGGLICINCTYACAACEKKIEDLAILTGDKAYCADCFRCRNCKRKIETLRYARTNQGLFCMPCHESLMERRRKRAKAAQARPPLPPPPVPTMGRSSSKIKNDGDES